MTLDVIHIAINSSFQRFQKYGLRNTEIRLTLTSFEIVHENIFQNVLKVTLPRTYYEQVNFVFFLYFK
jgi:hypothetical protein